MFHLPWEKTDLIENVDTAGCCDRQEFMRKRKETCTFSDTAHIGAMGFCDSVLVLTHTPWTMTHCIHVTSNTGRFKHRLLQHGCHQIVTDYLHSKIKNSLGRLVTMFFLLQMHVGFFAWKDVIVTVFHRTDCDVTQNLDLCLSW